MSFTLGSYVSTRRKALGLVQQKIADHLNYTVQSISAFESGESQLSLSSMPELANILELSLDDLFLETPNAPRVLNANRPLDPALFAKNLIALRKQKSLSQEQAAELLKISLRSITNYEKGNTLPSLEITQGILRAYGVKASTLFYEDLSLPLSPKKTSRFPIRILIPVLLVLAIGLGVGIPYFLGTKTPLIPQPILQKPLLFQVHYRAIPPRHPRPALQAHRVATLLRATLLLHRIVLRLPLQRVLRLPV